MTRSKTSLIHFFFSIIVIAVFSTIVWFIWYPKLLLIIEGGHYIMSIIFVVIMTLGPVLTLILYKPGKKGLWFDLYAIAILQSSAFVYSTYIVFQERPQYVVFNSDRFTLVQAADIDLLKLFDNSLTNSTFDHPKLIYSELPSAKEEKDKIMWSSVSGGKDLYQLPQYYQPLLRNINKLQNNPSLLSYTNVISTYPTLADEIQNFSQKYKINDMKSLLFYPLEGKKYDGIIVLATNKKVYWKIFLKDPWIIQTKDKFVTNSVIK